MVPHASAREGNCMRTVLCLLLLSNVCGATHPLVDVLKNSPEVANVKKPIDAPVVVHYLGSAQREAFA